MNFLKDEHNKKPINKNEERKILSLVKVNICLKIVSVIEI